MGVVPVVFGIRLQRGGVTGRHQVDSAERFAEFDSQSSISVLDRILSYRPPSLYELNLFAGLPQRSPCNTVRVSFQCLKYGDLRCASVSKGLSR